MYYCVVMLLCIVMSVMIAEYMGIAVCSCCSVFFMCCSRVVVGFVVVGLVQYR